MAGVHDSSSVLGLEEVQHRLGPGVQEERLDLARQRNVDCPHCIKVTKTTHVVNQLRHCSSGKDRQDVGNNRVYMRALLDRSAQSNAFAFIRASSPAID